MFRHSVIGLMLFCGCGAPRIEPETALVQDDAKYVVTVLIDMSGSFEHLMADGGKAYDFLLQIIDQYFRERLGTDDKIIIAQISGVDRALLWQGTPTELRRDFANANSFKKFLREKSSPAGSLVHSAVTRTISYAMSDPAIASKRAKSAVFVLSDFLDNGPDRDTSKREAVKVLKDYAQTGGTVGFYYVDQMLVPEWRQHLRDAGVKHCCVECEIVGRPTLPNFE